jgi:hypothetical protein
MIPTRRLGVALAVLALVALAGCAGLGLAPEDEGTPTFAPPTTAGDAPTTVDSGPDTYALGEVVELAQENTTVAVRVVDYRIVESYETTDGSGGTRTVEAPAGDTFVFVKLAVENVGDTDGSTPSVAVQPRNESADVSDSIPASFDDGVYRSVRPLEAGATTTGWAAVQVSGDVDAADVRVAFSPDILVTEDEFRWTLVDGDDEDD